MVREVDPNFIQSTVTASCQLAKHRQATALETSDVQMDIGMRFLLFLELFVIQNIQISAERQWNMWIPGFETDKLRPYKRAPAASQ